MSEYIKEHRFTLIRLILSSCLVVGATVFGRYSFYVSLGLYLGAYLISSCVIIVKAIVGLFRERRVGEKLLMTIASIGALVIGELFEAILISMLFEVGELIEELAIASSRSSVDKLRELRPESARLKGQTEPTNVEDVVVGDIIEVLAGERIPLDGIVVEGVGTVDTSAMTGESTPREVRRESEVLSGYLNLSSVLYVRVTRTVGQSAAQRIIDLSVGALDKKTKKEKFIRKFANIYTPIVILLAIAVALLPPLIDGFNYGVKD